jgi:autotransporter translocation and assembly factor TamB
VRQRLHVALPDFDNGAGGSLLRAAGDLFGGWLSSAGNSAYEIQRAVGGKAHDEALQKAVEEGKTHFHQCSRCGRWVCPEVCWNASAGQCEECAPDYQEELASAHARAKADATREQLNEKARADRLRLRRRHERGLDRARTRVTGAAAGDCVRVELFGVRRRGRQGEVLPRVRDADRAAQAHLHGLRPPARGRAEVLPRVRREDVRHELSGARLVGRGINHRDTEARL